MHTIWKFPLVVTDRQNIRLPSLHRVLSVQEQGDQIMMWVAVDTDASYVNETFVIVGTGYPIPDDIAIKDHVGSVQQGMFVWHVFQQGSTRR